MYVIFGVKGTQLRSNQFHDMIYGGRQFAHKFDEDGDQQEREEQTQQGECTYQKPLALAVYKDHSKKQSRFQ